MRLLKAFSGALTPFPSPAQEWELPISPAWQNYRGALASVLGLGSIGRKKSLVRDAQSFHFFPTLVTGKESSHG